MSPVAAGPKENAENAHYLCSMLDGTGLMSEPCAVSGWNSSVTATIDMDGGEARDLCGKLARSMRSNGKTFDKGWTLQIKSPYSNDKSIAFCNL